MINVNVANDGRNLRVPTSLVTRNSMYFSGYFQAKSMNFQVNLVSNDSVCVDNVDMTKI